MESKRVFVENLPKPKRWLHEYSGIIIASLALVISVCSLCLLKKEFIAAHRPYVYASSRKDDKGTMDLKSVMLCCLNAPAKINNLEIYYEVVSKKEGGKEDVNTIPWKLPLTPFLLYPDETTHHQTHCPYDFKKEILENDPNVKLKRKARIDYKELSSDRTYHFEGNWDYNRTYNIWVTGNMFGD